VGSDSLGQHPVGNWNEGMFQGDKLCDMGCIYLSGRLLEENSQHL